MSTKPYTTWHVSEDEDYKLVLTAQQICELEDKLGGANLMSAIGNAETGMPPLRTMMLVTQAATGRYNHGIKLGDVYAIYDRYIEAGGSQVDFYTDVYVKIFEASGFFPRAQAETIAEAVESLKE